MEELWGISIIIGIANTVLSMILCPIIAGHKGRSVGGWLFGGLILGIIGLIIVACLPNLKKERLAQYSADAENASRHRDRTVYEEIEHLKELYDIGIITREDFEEKKRKLLGL